MINWYILYVKINKSLIGVIKVENIAVRAVEKRNVRGIKMTNYTDIPLFEKCAEMPFPSYAGWFGISFISIIY